MYGIYDGDLRDEQRALDQEYAVERRAEDAEAERLAVEEAQEDSYREAEESRWA